VQGKGLKRRPFPCTPSRLMIELNNVCHC